MPASPRSLRVTELYQARLLAVRDRLARDLRREWESVSVEDFDATYDTVAVSDLITAAQQEGVRISEGYLAAFLSTELGRRVAGPSVSIEIGLTRAARPLADAARGPIIGVKMAIGEGVSPEEALEAGLPNLLRVGDVAADHAARAALTAGMAADDRINGWRRAIRGTCGACLGAATGARHDAEEMIEVHPGCQCVQEPTVRNVRERVPRLSGAQVFAAMSTADQDDVIGPEKAELIRAGEIAITDLVTRSPLEHEPDFITEAPLEALTP